MDTLSLYDQYIHNMIDLYSNKYKDSIAIQDKVTHIINCGKIARKIQPNNDLLYLGALFHDIGRFIQYDEIQTFDDKQISHCIVGQNYFDKEVKRGNIPDTDWNEYLRNAICWHETGLYNIDVTEQALKEFVQSIRDIDVIENGCLGVKTYMEREIQTDAKGYKKQHPTLNMAYIRPQYIEDYLEGKVLAKDCITYAEYLLFAAHLTVQALVKYPIAKSIMTDDLMSWYHDMFYKYMTLINAAKAYKKLMEVLK
ncbi:MAG: HD domain-containing protein [Lachnospiraceae bacterium]|nr:HD domain-containing protein [Lachnospiraceae bacterium]